MWNGPGRWLKSYSSWSDPLMPSGRALAETAWGFLYGLYRSKTWACWFYVLLYIHTYTHKSSKQPYCLCHRVEIRVGCSTMCHPGQESKPFSLGRCLRADITAFFIPNFADNGPPLLDNFCQGKPERVHLQPFTLSSLQLNWRVNDLEQ